MDHLGIGVSEVDRTKRFYEAELAHLGWTSANWRANTYVSFKKSGSPALYFLAADRVAPVHLALRAPTEQAVDEFFRLALAAGGVSNGPPGPRPAYREGYYAAFVLDPDGHNVEAVLGGVY